MDVIVGGAGIIGLSAALEIARTGRNVRVLEKERAMSQASWAAAGMLAAHDPELPSQLTELAGLSLALYPEYLRTLERLSGCRVPLRTTNAIQVLSAAGSDHPSSPMSRMLSAEDAVKLVPGLTIKGRSFLWLQESSLDPRDLCAALPAAAQAAGIELVEGTEVFTVTSTADAVEVTTSRGTMQAGAFVNCCGAWAGRVHHAGPHNPVDPSPAATVEPWKGQMHTLRLAPPLALQYVVRSPEVYLVPRGDGLVVVGATVERVGFNRAIEPTALAWLRALSADLWPPMGSALIEDSWTGLRPGTPDSLPLIGSAGQPHCWVATGHFRNGILLAPATALLVRQLLDGETPAVNLSSFLPGR